MDTEKLTQEIREALVAHGKWKTTLQDAIKSGVLPKPSKDIAVDDQCSFGKWLKTLSQDPVIRLSPNFAAVQRAHANFHLQAGQVAALIEKNQADQAQQALGGTGYVGATNALVKAMEEWKSCYH